MDSAADGRSEAELIQMMFPTEPDWSRVSDSALIYLVKDFVCEQSCATSALCSLSARKHPEARELARWLLTQEDADKWLKACAAERIE